MTRAKTIIAGVILIVALAGAAAAYIYYSRIQITEYPVPERVESAPVYANADSVIVTSIGIPLRRMQRGLEADIPRKLWSIDRKMDECVPRKNIRVFGENITKTPKISCRIIGNVRRGAISLRGRGDAIVVRFPVSATIRAEDVGGVIKRETGTGSAIVELTAKLAIGSDWRMRSKLDLSYRWARQPGIDFLGQRIRFTNRADDELKSVIAKVEQSLERQLQKISVRDDVAQLWAQGFTTVSLSRDNPPVWLRMTPKNVGIGKFRARGGRLTADVSLRAMTEIVVGDKPPAPEKTPLGSNTPAGQSSGFKANFPVLASYAEIEPVILRALKQLAEKGIEKDALGQLDIAFEKVTLYPTNDGRIAVGITADIKPVGNITGDVWGTAKGQIWLTGSLVSEANSEIIRIKDLHIFGDTDTAAGDLLVRVMESADVRSEIEKALVEDFAQDYADVIGKARAGIAAITMDGVTLNLDISSVEHGPIQVTGDGLFMPITASGTARTTLNR